MAREKRNKDSKDNAPLDPASMVLDYINRRFPGFQETGPKERPAPKFELSEKQKAGRALQASRRQASWEKDKAAIDAFKALSPEEQAKKVESITRAQKREKAIYRNTLRAQGYVPGKTRRPTRWEMDNPQFYDPTGTPLNQEGGADFNYNVVGGGKAGGSNKYLGADVRGYVYSDKWSQDPTFDAPDLNVRYDEKGNPEPPMPGDYTKPTPYTINKTTPSSGTKAAATVSKKLIPETPAKKTPPKKVVPKVTAKKIVTAR